jgi:hypothetical protein
MDITAYYTEQSRVTDPGAYSRLFDDLPSDIPGLCRVVQGLIIHYRGGEMFNYTIPKERLPEIDTCYVEKMLARIIEMDARSLNEARTPEHRLVGCCRDFSTLFCSMARYRGIPTRVRVGFANYFVPNFNVDHVIVECWDADQQRWRPIDPELSPLHIKENHITFDVLDVPRDSFIVGGLAWQWYRAGKIDPDLFGVDPHVDVKGADFIAERLVLDLAAMNKREMLVWDAWGIMLKDILSDENAALLDNVAALTQGGDATFDAVQAAYEDTPDLRVPETVTRFSPLGGAPREVKLEI